MRLAMKTFNRAILGAHRMASALLLSGFVLCNFGAQANIPYSKIAVVEAANDWDSWPRDLPPALQQKLPRLRLADTVDLVVGLALRKRQQFGFKRRQEGRPLRKKHKTRLEFRLIDIEPADFVALDRNEPHGSVKIDRS